MTKNGNTINWRVEQLEKNYCEIDKKIDEIMTNHLPHMKEDLGNLSTKISILTAVNIGAIIIGIIVNKYF